MGVTADRSVVAVTGQTVSDRGQRVQVESPYLSSLAVSCWSPHSHRHTTEPSISDLYAADKRDECSVTTDGDEQEDELLYGIKFHDVRADGISVLDWSYLDPDCLLDK